MAELVSTRVLATCAVRREEGVRRYRLSGRQSDLLAKGLVREAWFPNGERNGRGQAVRTKETAIEEGVVRCCCIRGDRYDIFIPYPPEEAVRREAEQDAVCQQNTARILFEDAVLYNVRALDERGRAYILGIARELVSALRTDKSADRTNSIPYLRLVVDNAGDSAR